MKMSFDASKHDRLQPLEAIPAGWYSVVIESMVERDNADNSGTHLAVTYTVTDGKYAGRKVFGNLNVGNESEKARKFAFDSIATICDAVNLESFEDTDELLDRGFLLDVGVQNDATYGKKNTVRGYQADGASTDQGAEAEGNSLF